MNFERIKPAHKHSKLDAVEFEKKKREERKKDKLKRTERKFKWVEEDSQ